MMSNYPDPILSKNLKKLCAEKNITQGNLAKICNRDRKTAHNWINEYSGPSALDLKLICMRFNVSADELLGLK